MSTFHAGEIAVQKRAGESQIAARNGRIISDAILPGAKPFLAEQRMLIAGSVSADGSVWASAVFGEPGFARAEGSHAIRIDRKRVFADAGDPLWSNLDRPVGLLFID